MLDEGELFGIYPEGTRSHDGRLYRGKIGVARLALETGVPVIPVAVVGTDVVAPPGKKFGTFTRPVVRFGKPLDFSRYEGMENDRYILRSITDEIMYEIMRLSGQEYVDMYASRAKEESKRLEKEAAGGPRRGRASRRRRPDRAGRRRRARVRRPRRGRGPAVPGARGAAGASCCSTRSALNLYRADNFAHPLAGVACVVVMVAWTGVAIWAYAAPARRTAAAARARPGGRRWR